MAISASLDRLDVPGFDLLLKWPFFAIAFTALAMGVVAITINITDGYNGLLGGYTILVPAANPWFAAQVGDPVVLTARLGVLGASMRMMPWN